MNMNMNRKFAWSLCLLTFALCLGTVPASADTIFTDLGPAGDVYYSWYGWLVAGDAGGTQTGWSAADMFTAAIGGDPKASPATITRGCKACW